VWQMVLLLLFEDAHGLVHFQVAKTGPAFFSSEILNGYCIILWYLDD
jgi:hypothetical protein